MIVVSGFSGAGKTSLIKSIPAEMNMELIMSYTTRSPRGENDWYHFVDRAVFEKMAAEGIFAEYTQYGGNGCCYGTPRADIISAIARGKTPLLDIDQEGFQRLRKAGIGDIRSIFVAADPEELYLRLKSRGTENEDTLRRRLVTAMRESEFVTSYDYVIMNHDLKAAEEVFLCAVQGIPIIQEHFDNEKFCKDCLSLPLFKGKM